MPLPQQPHLLPLGRGGDERALRPPRRIHRAEEVMVVAEVAHRQRGEHHARALDGELAQLDIDLGVDRLVAAAPQPRAVAVALGERVSALLCRQRRRQLGLRHETAEATDPPPAACGRIGRRAAAKAGVRDDALDGLHDLVGVARVAVEPAQQPVAVRGEDLQQLRLRDEELVVGHPLVVGVTAATRRGGGGGGGARRDVDVPRIEVGEVDLRDEQRRGRAVVKRVSREQRLQHACRAAVASSERLGEPALEQWEVTAPQQLLQLLVSRLQRLAVCAAARLGAARAAGGAVVARAVEDERDVPLHAHEQPQRVEQCERAARRAVVACVELERVAAELEQRGQQRRGRVLQFIDEQTHGRREDVAAECWQLRGRRARGVRLEEAGLEAGGVEHRLERGLGEGGDAVLRREESEQQRQPQVGDGEELQQVLGVGGRDPPREGGQLLGGEVQHVVLDAHLHPRQPGGVGGGERRAWAGGAAEEGAEAAEQPRGRGPGGVGGLELRAEAAHGEAALLVGGPVEQRVGDAVGRGRRQVFGVRRQQHLEREDDVAQRAELGAVVAQLLALARQVAPQLRRAHHRRLHRLAHELGEAVVRVAHLPRELLEQRPVRRAKGHRLLEAEDRVRLSPGAAAADGASHRVEVVEQLRAQREQRGIVHTHALAVGSEARLEAEGQPRPRRRARVVQAEP
eukprot:scaffold16424_cov61-Phaeocystis_antarctica.AAC.7